MVPHVYGLSNVYVRRYWRLKMQIFFSLTYKSRKLITHLICPLNVRKLFYQTSFYLVVIISTIWHSLAPLLKLWNKQTKKVVLGYFTHHWKKSKKSKSTHKFILIWSSWYGLFLIPWISVTASYHLTNHPSFLLTSTYHISSINDFKKAWCKSRLQTTHPSLLTPTYHYLHHQCLPWDWSN